MSFDLTTFKNWLTETEADVQAIITNIKSDVAVVESDIDAALHWIASNETPISNAIIQVVNLIEAFGVAGNPEVAAGVAAANLAVQGLNAFAGAVSSGQNDVQSVITGYAAVKQAQAQIAAATAAAVVAGPTTPAK